ncbi:MAG: hypothetical protein U0326_21350 [Polyangiales bacterium]
MLLLDPPPEVIAGVAVFRDHASKSHFHYVPAAPRVARTADGPELSFVRYREDPSKPLAAGVAQRMGGGFLSFTVELAVERETLDAVRAALRERGVDEPVLSPVVFTSGRAVLATVAAHVPAAGEPAPRAPEVFEVILGDTTPSLEGTERALFALALPDEAAAALGAALLRMPGPTPLGVRYELEYAGLRPALDVKVRADKKRISDSLKAGFAAGVTYQGWSLDVDVGKTVQKLVQDGAIEVEVTRFSDEAEWRQSADAALEWFKQDLIQRFFAPALSPEGGERATGEAILNAVKAIGADSLASVIKNPELVDKVSRAAGVSPETVKQFSAGGGGQGNGMPFSLRLGFQYRELHQEEEGTLVADYAVTAAEKRIAAPQGLLDALTADVDASKVIRDVTLGGDFLRRLDVLVSPVGDLAAFGVSSMLVDLTHPADAPDGTVTRTLEFTPERSAAQAFSVWLDDPNAGSYRYRARLVFAPDGPLAGGARRSKARGR